MVDRITVAICLGSLAACTANTSLTRLDEELAGENCDAGGTRIESGIDEDQSGTLEDDEVDQINYVCDGADAVDYLTVAREEPEGKECGSGGLRIEGGPDENGNGQLDTDEVAEVQYICNAASGSLVEVSEELAGTNCPFGGVKVESGLDDDDNGALDPEEVTETEYICNGGAGTVVTASSSSLAATGGTSGADTLTLQQATIDVPAPGSLIAIGTADAFCEFSGTGTSYDCGAGVPAGDGCLRVTESATAGCIGGGSDPYSYFWMAPRETVSVTRTLVIPVDAGTHTLYLRGGNNGSGISNELGFWRRSLTLIYTPD